MSSLTLFGHDLGLNSHIVCPGKSWRVPWGTRWYIGEYSARGSEFLFLGVRHRLGTPGCSKVLRRPQPGHQTVPFYPRAVYVVASA